MGYKFGADGESRLHAYLDRIGGVLGNKKQRASFATYLLGLLSDCDRKSVEPIAAQACGDPERCRAMQEQLLHFLADSPWQDRSVRLCATRYAIAAMTERETVQAWILDDTGFIKQGNMSPGVQRQYTGSAGKTTNCQIGVSLTLATATIELPVDMDLYLPKSWTEDPARCRKAHIPSSMEYRPKWRIALDLIERASDADLPRALVLADSAYGDVGAFREGVRKLGLDYAVDVKKHTRIRLVCRDGSVSDIMSVADAADVIGASAYRKATWRQGTQRALSSRFATQRVRVVRAGESDGEEQWLVIERPSASAPPEHYVLATLPKSATRKRLVSKLKQRWRIERTYEDMKGEFGLDHFEGRSYKGWHHHASTVLACYAFVVAERSRAFPPSARGAQSRNALEHAA
jgi:SRSO17 transposase